MWNAKAFEAYGKVSWLMGFGSGWTVNYYIYNKVTNCCEEVPPLSFCFLSVSSHVHLCFDLCHSLCLNLSMSFSLPYLSLSASFPTNTHSTCLLPQGIFDLVRLYFAATGDCCQCLIKTAHERGRKHRSGELKWATLSGVSRLPGRFTEWQTDRS